MTSIMDLAVVALALMVGTTLGLLAWTLGVTVPRALHRLRRDLIQARLQVTVTERRVRELREQRLELTEGDR